MPARVRGVLRDSGRSVIDIQPLDVDCRVPETALIPCFTRLGPLGRVFHAPAPTLRERVIETVRAAFDPYVHGTEVRFQPACWTVAARAPATQRLTADG